jgi:hypothetical protein
MSRAVDVCNTGIPHPGSQGRAQRPNHDNENCDSIHHGEPPTWISTNKQIAQTFTIKNTPLLVNKS